MHLFCHLLVALLLFFRCPLVFDRLYTPLGSLPFSSTSPYTVDTSNVLVFHPLSRPSFPSPLPSSRSLLSALHYAFRTQFARSLGERRTFEGAIVCLCHSHNEISKRKQLRREPLPFLRSPGAVNVDTVGAELAMVSIIRLSYDFELRVISVAVDHSNGITRRQENKPESSHLQNRIYPSSSQANRNFQKGKYSGTKLEK